MDAVLIPIRENRSTRLIGVGGSVTLNESQRCMAYTIDAADVVYLPPVKQCTGNVYTHRVASYTSDEVTLTVNGADTDTLIRVTGDGTGSKTAVLDAADEFIVLYSSGYHWYIMMTNIA